MCAVIVVGAGAALGQPALCLMVSLGAFAPLYADQGPARWQDLLKQADEIGQRILTIVDGEPGATETAAEIQWLREKARQQRPEN